MNLVHPHVSAIAPSRMARVFAIPAMAMLTGATESVWCAESMASIVSENMATAQQRRVESLTLTPEVSTVRTRLLPPGPSPLTSDGRPMSEMAGITYRVWVSRGRADMGVGLGTLGYVIPRPDGRIDGPVALSGASPTLSIGLRYRVTPRSAVFADASEAYGLGVDPNTSYVNTKLGMEWKPAKHALGFERGAIGMHFDSGYRLSVKPRHGGLGVYLRGQF